MIYMNIFGKTLSAVSIGLMPMLVSSAAFAHTGHSHAQNDALSGALHSLMTHPLLFGVIGMALILVVFLYRD
jgi:hypothetical protein